MFIIQFTFFQENLWVEKICSRFFWKFVLCPPKWNPVYGLGKSHRFLNWKLFSKHAIYRKGFHMPFIKLIDGHLCIIHYCLMNLTRFSSFFILFPTIPYEMVVPCKIKWPTNVFVYISGCSSDIHWQIKCLS